MEELQIENLKNGKYNLFGKFLVFEIEGSKLEFIIDKKSALEIMTTLLDSENLLTKEAENLIEDLEDKIQKHY